MVCEESVYDAVDRAEIAYACVKIRNFEPPLLHRINFPRLHLRLSNDFLLVRNKLPNLRLVDDVTLRIFCSVGVPNYLSCSIHHYSIFHDKLPRFDC